MTTDKNEELLKTGIYQISKCILKGEVSPVELVENLLCHIEKIDSKLNTFITINREGALSHAQEMEKEIKQGNYRGPLHGIPIGLKDNINTNDMKTTAGSEIYKDNIPDEDATVVNLLKKSGVVIIGKQNTHQFAYGPTGDRSHFGAVRNPYDTKRITGGSSSGSSSGVAACLCYGALGTDTGGSVRIPSSFCGVVGMKPTFGRVSKRGVYPLSWILDHVGPITRTIHDNALLLNAIAVYDPEDDYAIEYKTEDFTRFIGKDIKNKVIGIPNHFYFDNLDVEIAIKIEETIKVFELLGATTAQVNLPSMEAYLDAQRVILRSDAYGIHKENLDKFPDKWDYEVKQRLLTGVDIKGFDYSNALNFRNKAKREFSKIFNEVDVIVTPTMSILPSEVNKRHLRSEKSDENHIRWTITKLTSPTNLVGHPSLTVPCGFSNDGMPIGIQLIGREFGEAQLYQVGYALEQELSIPTAKPNIN